MTSLPPPVEQPAAQPVVPVPAPAQPFAQPAAQPFRRQLVAMPSLDAAVNAASSALASNLVPASATLQAPTPLPAEPGYSTTEFAITGVSQVLGWLAATGVIGGSTAERLTGVAGVVITAAFYAISRGIRKRGTPG